MDGLLIYASPGESMQDVFPSWLRLCYDGLTYQPFDLNMPPSIPRRPPSHLEVDPPLTQHGEVVAQLTGKSIRLGDIQPVVIYSSPEYRSVQTAAYIVKALESPCYICVEDGLQSWTQLLTSPLQPLHPRDFSQLGLLVSEGYKPFLSHQRINPSESFSMFTDRIRAVNKYLIRHLEGPTMIVADPAVLLLAEGQVFNRPQELLQTRSKLRACSVLIYEVSEAGQLKKKHDLIMPVTDSLSQARKGQKSQ